MPNHLANEISPYLIQHVNNPVDWFPWNQGALEKAKKEDKPIFLSIGYAACHWCHVMEHESFEDISIAAIMNEHFVSIKVDREERPDLDSIYMTATQAMTGSGGWPMSVFLTPDLQPFYAGTYFPPVRRYNMPSFREVLLAVANAWKTERTTIIDSSQKIVAHIQAQASQGEYELGLTQEHLSAAVNSLHHGYDWGYGGWGQAPKFPQPMTIDFLLRQTIQGNETALTMTTHVLRSMAKGGMYDRIGGGFARYSVDNFWRTPHFEKMLYDNAQLALAYLHAYQVTRDEQFRRVSEDTLDFVMREMTHPEGGFYSSLDADSDGEEGKYYTWTAAEIQKILAEEYAFFQTAYGITEHGNWEGKTILQCALDDSTLAARFKLDNKTVTVKLAECHSRLLKARESRIRPATDDKILAAWNGLTLAAFAEAARILPNTSVVSEKKNERKSRAKTKSASFATLVTNDKYYHMATRNADFLLTSLRPDGRLRRSWRDGTASEAIFLEDYAALILGLLELYQTDFDNRWFASALELAEEMIRRFADPAGGFFDTPANGETLLIRPKELQDNAIPSGNALACEALLKLAAFTDRGDFRDLAENSLCLIGETALRYPTAFARWLSVADFAAENVKQIAILGEAGGKTIGAWINLIRSEYRPNVVVAASPYPPDHDAPALLINRPMLNGKVTLYVCEGFVCKQPIVETKALHKLLR